MCVQEHNVMFKKQVKGTKMPAVGSLETVMAQLLWMCPENFSLSSIDLLILFLVSELQIFPCHS